MQTLKNSVHLIGHVGQPPEIVRLESGKKLAKFSLATNEHYTNTLGETVEKTQWHNIVFWGKLADFIEGYVTKGSQLVVEGSLATRSWEDDKGQKHYRTEVVGREILLLGKK